MAVEVTINSIVRHDPAAGIDKTQSALIVEGALALSDDYGGASTHGDTIDFSDARVTSSSPPRRVEIFQVPPAGQAPLAYSFLYGQGTTQANGVLIVTSSAGVELTEGDPYPGPLTDDDPSPSIRFRATFPLFV